ncbi:MAG TPA: hypothetical protein VF070_38265 [Streptosporangiaceae bacterium]
MSFQPHTVLPWVVRRTRLPLRSLRCVDCLSEPANDPELVASRLLDPLLAWRNHVVLDWTGAWRLDTPSALLGEVWPVQVKAGLEAPVPVRPERRPQRMPRGPVSWPHRISRLDTAKRRPRGQDSPRAVTHCAWRIHGGERR